MTLSVMSTPSTPALSMALRRFVSAVPPQHRASGADAQRWRELARMQIEAAAHAADPSYTAGAADTFTVVALGGGIAGHMADVPLGYVAVAPLGGKLFKRHRCARWIRTLEQRLGHPLRPYYVTDALVVPEARGWGAGVALYVEAARAVGPGACLIAGGCVEGETTQPDAQQVWSSRRFAEQVDVEGWVAHTRSR